MSLTELPFGLPGRVYRSAMPFSAYDPGARLLLDYNQMGISVVAQLVSDEESWQRTGLFLRTVYLEAGFDVIYLPITDFSVPAAGELGMAVTQALEHVTAGSNLVVHCFAGIGRTGLFLACMARRIHGFTGDEAIRWVRQYIPGALEAPRQVELARAFV